MSNLELMQAVANREQPRPPVSEILGWELEEVAPGRARCRFAAQPEWYNPAGVVQGGFVTAMIDDTMGPAVFSAAEPGEFPLTLELKVNFIKPVRAGEIVVEAELVQRAGRVLFAQARLYNEKGELAATATSTSSIAKRELWGRMASWGEFCVAEPEMAKVMTLSLAWIPITYLATVRKDGAPRVHPVCPIIGKGRMFVAVNQTSPKRFDLKNDGRFAMHALPGKDDAEFYMTGRVAAIEDAPSRQLCAKSAGHTVHESDWIFEFEIERVMTAHWEKVGQPDTYAVRKFWHAP